MSVILDHINNTLAGFTSPAGGVTVKASGITQVTLTTDGKIGIGMSPTYPLDVSGIIRATEFVGKGTFSSGTTITDNSANPALIITQDGTGPALRINDVSGDTTPFVVDATGAVGIGTATPTSAKLHVMGGAIRTDSQITSDVVTGTAPFSVASTTVVPNLNVTGATKLVTPRSINGTSFDGTADITIPSNLTNGITFNNSGTGATSGTTATGASAVTVSYNTIGSPKSDGTGASGTWGISISGNAATASNATNLGSYNWAAPDVIGSTTPNLATFSGLTVSGTGAVKLAAGTTAQRPSGIAGHIRYNSDIAKFEGYNGSTWAGIGSGGAVGGGNDTAFYENDIFITSNYTIGQGEFATCTISNATPAVVTITNSFVADQPVHFSTTGALPTGLAVDTVYYVSATGLSSASFQVSATAGGASIATSSAGSGVHQVGKMKNGGSFGPITIKSGAALTVPAGSVFTLN